MVGCIRMRYKRWIGQGTAIGNRKIDIDDDSDVRRYICLGI